MAVDFDFEVAAVDRAGSISLGISPDHPALRNAAACLLQAVRPDPNQVYRVVVTCTEADGAMVAVVPAALLDGLAVSEGRMPPGLQAKLARRTRLEVICTAIDTNRRD